MAVSVIMPALEMAQETGKVISWKKKEGERVSKGESLLEVETDKAVVEVESPGEGILCGVKAREGAVIPVGQNIAWLLQPGEAVPAETAQAQTGRRTDSACGTSSGSGGGCNRIRRADGSQNLAEGAPPSQGTRRGHRSLARIGRRRRNPRRRYSRCGRLAGCAGNCHCRTGCASGDCRFCRADRKDSGPSAV